MFSYLDTRSQSILELFLVASESWLFFYYHLLGEIRDLNIRLDKPSQPIVRFQIN